MQSGVPFPAAHLLSNHYNKTRQRYYQELDRSSKAADGVVRFVEYAVDGFVDGLREQLQHIRDQQWEVAWRDFIHEWFRDKDTQAYRRQKHLVLDLPGDRPVPQKELASISARVAADYRSKGDKTVSRDANALLKAGLVVKRGGGYAANRGLILAFLPPRCDETIEAKSNETLF